MAPMAAIMPIAIKVLLAIRFIGVSPLYWLRVDGYEDQLSTTE
jgi:hypothetical protein